ncbi:Rieske [2Fe-2S] domain-containing protein [Haloechinothrix alba]|uniref:Rieske [2Fe-2S] domain-containing protein n=1 Tax=Haloechinothrix alba TaxID=664784 RepID=A0A239A7S3_9PSEU|nr:aromatic ring-hydroxylating dioxygenase subunit alpha [Haloechinothrix alba]SNR90933.1 Rieske [2Fe-2S] domain-containing protein [Haloechinothrix alba]
MTTVPTDGGGQPEGPSVQEYLDRDTKPVPETLRYSANDQTDPTDIPIERYTSKEFAQVEMEKMWYRVWQFACLEQEIPEVGDHVIYEIGDMSYIVVRTEPDTIRAYVNACLHRSRLLRDRGGTVPELRCSFHGWTWNLDGSMKNLPCAWDFPHVDKDKLTLPEAKVGTWRGFVFLNPDPDAGPLSEFLGDFPEKWIWPIEQRYKAVHVAKVLPLNWKAAQEAFMETYHVIATHPQIMTWTADANSQYDATSDQPHWNRMINVQGAPSPHVADFVEEQDVLESFYAARTFYSVDAGRDLQAGEEGIPDVPEGSSARAVLAEAMRKQLSELSGTDYSDYSDSELLDTVQHTVFPNFHPWGGFKSNICYRWRPNGFNPDSCIFETIIMADPPQSGEKPPPAKVRWVDEDEKFSDVEELGLLGPVFDQDIDNMLFVQRGMKATRKAGLTLGQYQESRIRQMHHTLGKWMEK